MKHKPKRILIGLLVGCLIIPAAFAAAQEAIDPTFDPGMLIPDSAFNDVGTFGTAAGIQQFLELKGSVLANTDPAFLAKLQEPDTTTKVALEDPEPSLSRLRTAAELIYDSATHWGLNPQVTLVMLQKEQSLITGNFSSDANLQTALNHAVGFGCPDNAACGDIFEGFYRQLFGSFDSEGNRWLGQAASLMKSFNTTVNGVQVGRGPMVDAANETFGNPTTHISRKGDTIVIDNTTGGYAAVPATQTVTLSNFATAALYRYTPHVFNGNYNFWKFYTQWFKYPNGTVIKLLSDATQYVIDNGTKRPFSTFVATQRKLNLTNIITVSQTEFDSYPTEKPLPPVENTLIKGDVDGTVYLIQDSAKHPISYPVFVQRKLSFAKVITLPQAEVDSYDQGTYLTPVDGTLIVATTDPTVYIIDSTLKRPISGAIFKVRKLSFNKIMKLSDTEVTSIPSGPFLTPPEKSAIKSANDSSIYWFQDNLKHYMSAFVFKQRGAGAYGVIPLSDAEMLNIPLGPPFPPKDGTVFKGDQTSGIYIMQDGLKHLLTAAAYKRLRYPRATVLPEGEVDMYNPGDDITK